MTYAPSRGKRERESEPNEEGRKGGRERAPVIYSRMRVRSLLVAEV